MTTPDRDRLGRLEETLGFVEQRAERSRADLAELSRQVYELTHAVERLERRLDAMADRLPAPGVEGEGEGGIEGEDDAP